MLILDAAVCIAKDLNLNPLVERRGEAVMSHTSGLERVDSCFGTVELLLEDALHCNFLLGLASGLQAARTAYLVAVRVALGCLIEPDVLPIRLVDIALLVLFVDHETVGVSAGALDIAAICCHCR